MKRQDENSSCDFGSTNEIEGPDKRKQRSQTLRAGERTMNTSLYAKAGSMNNADLKSKEIDVEQIFEQANGHTSPEV